MDIFKKNKEKIQTLEKQLQDKEKISELESKLKSKQAELDSFLLDPSKANQKLLEQIAVLEFAIKAQKSAPDTPKQEAMINALREELTSAREKLAEQDELLKRLVQHPIPIATVIKVEKEVKKARPKDFKKGVKVRLCKDSEYYDNNDELGEVVNKADAEGYVNVRFYHSEELLQYRIGNPKIDNGICDLEIVGDKKINAIIFMQGRLMEVTAPEDADIQPGDTVKLSTQTMQIIEVIGRYKIGETAVFKQAIDHETCEIEHQGNVLAVFCGNFAKELKAGDKVILDSSKSVIIDNLGQEEERFSLSETINITWNDIGGLESAKQKIREAIELPYKYKDLYHYYGRKMVKGILLEGPPGCGKTLLGKAMANSLATIHHQGLQATKTGFLYVKGPELLNRYVGTSEENVRILFARGKQHFIKYGYPCLLFIDEAEALLSKRGTGRSSDINDTVVPMFLAEMDGIAESTVIVVLATNRADRLDSAVLRDGRIDTKIRIDRPNAQSASEIFRIHLGKIPLNNGYSHEELAKFATARIFTANEFPLYKIEYDNVNVSSFDLANVINGAMIANMVSQAISNAINRDIESGTQDGSGLAKNDLQVAIADIYRQNLHINYEDDLHDYVENNRKKGKITHVEKIKEVNHV